MSRDDGGPAFPRTGDHSVIQPQSGMSLRDHFAGLALQSILTWREKILSWECDDDDASGTAAMVAYEYADAMLRERSKP